MGKSIIIAAVAVAIGAATVGCSHKNVDNNGANVPGENVAAVAVPEGAASYMPKATAFRMSGPYADHVAVTLGPNGNPTYFPAPSDISDNSLPVYLGDGWWLNRQGLGPGSVFTSWTMAEYAKLPNVPTISEIKAHIIPGACVTDFRRTSVPAGSAMKDLSKIKSDLGL